MQKEVFIFLCNEEKKINFIVTADKEERSHTIHTLLNSRSINVLFTFTKQTFLSYFELFEIGLDVVHHNFTSEQVGQFDDIINYINENIFSENV